MILFVILKHLNFELFFQIRSINILIKEHNKWFLHRYLLILISSKKMKSHTFMSD